MTALCVYGFLVIQEIMRLVTPLNNMWKTRSRGGSSICVDQADQKSTIWCGLPTAYISSLAQWTTLPVFMIHAMVVSFCVSLTVGQCIRNIGEHSHYVQGVAWDPLGEYIATQSSDRSVHIWALKTRDGQFTLSQYNRSTRIELPTRRISGSPAPTDMATLFAPTRSNQGHDIAPSPTPSTPGTPTSMSMPMNPPPFSSSRRSSFSGSPAQSSVSAFRRSASPSPALPLPAVKPSSSPKAQPGPKSMYLFHNEALLSFFRRLSFSTDGSLLLAPAGQYRSGTSNGHEHPSKAEELSNTVFVYTRAGLNKCASH